MISKENQVKLRRMSELDAVIRRDDMETEEEVWSEYRTLKDEVMEECLTALRKMIKAGILSIDLTLTPEIVEEIASDKYASIGIDVLDCYENGGICLEAAPEMSSATYQGNHHQD